MIRHISILILIFCINSVSYSQNSQDGGKSNCYLEKICLNTSAKVYKDTVIMIRNYIETKDDKRIICNDFIVEEETQKLIWDCKYIRAYLTYQDRMNKFSILSFRVDRNKDVISSYFLCDRETKETIEMVRFKIANNKIVGINLIPVSNGFIPIDEYDKQEIDMIDIIID